MRTRTRKLLGTTAATLGLAAAVLTGAAGPAGAAGTADGCPYGAVCIYAGGTTDTAITNIYWSYGAHNLSGQYGYHAIVNNQYGFGTWARLCYGYNGVNCTAHNVPRYEACTCYTYFNLTPINSIYMAPYFP